MVYCLCPATKPEQVSAKGMTGKKHELVMRMADNPNKFKTDLGNACCAEPVCCIVGTCCAFTGIPACYMRKKVLEDLGRGIDDFVCCQPNEVGPIPCCGTTLASCCPGSMVGLCLEGCCFPVFSVSISRLYVMEKKRLHPDPVDYQIIQCSNCLQMAACVCYVLSMFIPELRDAFQIIDCIADTFTASVVGCMCAQVEKELKGPDGKRVHPHIEPAGAAAQAAMAAPQPQVMTHHMPQPAYVAAPAVVAAPVMPQTFAVVVPPGAPAGTQMQVQAPNGVMMMVQVPPGTMPGQQIMVQY